MKKRGRKPKERSPYLATYFVQRRSEKFLEKLGFKCIRVKEGYPFHFIATRRAPTFRFNMYAVVVTGHKIKPLDKQALAEWANYLPIIHCHFGFKRLKGELRFVEPFELYDENKNAAPDDAA
ncbi:MAG: hypothetical protein KatS3mg038_2163 [Candidatus Kapaibacterium sp.]|nr:MAG: hypothetical protein KatS3mg038_2163 [Candidatus Kapabacteria bacterium]